MGTIRVLRDPHNLSHSRLKSVLSCGARSGYESFYDQRVKAGAPYWLVGGAATHHVLDSLLERTAVIGKVLPADKVEEIIKKARGHIWSVLNGAIPPRGHKDPASRLQNVLWMSEEERLKKSPPEMEMIIKQKRGRYINQVTPAIRAMAIQATYPSPFRWTKVGVRFDNKLFFESPRNPEIKIPVYGEIDKLDMHSRGLIITDWKTGNFNYYLQQDLEGNEQMLIYWAAIRELYRFDPVIAYFVSLSVFPWDIKKFGERVLETEQYRVQARIRFEEHFPELLREMDDVWAMLNFLAHPPITAREQKEREEWQPSSASGIRMGLNHHVQQNRLIPSIGKHCGMCPARPLCQQDNKEDWQEYEARQRLGNVVEPLHIIPEGWLEPFHDTEKDLFETSEDQEALETDEQMTLFNVGKIKRRSPLRNHNMKAKDWKKAGFYTPKELLALARRMHEIIPVENGIVCPCKKTERIPSFLLSEAAQFFDEREAHKRAQEAEGKTRSGEGDQKVKDLYDSQTVRTILHKCPIEGCPFGIRIVDSQAG